MKELHDDSTLVGHSRIAVVPTFNTQFDGPPPPDWDYVVMSRVLYDPDPRPASTVPYAPTSMRCPTGRRRSTYGSFLTRSPTGQASSRRLGSRYLPATTARTFFA